MKKGIDVSYANGVIDWNKVKSQIDFVIIRCGYGKNTESQDDKQFKRNIDECIRLGIPFGIYLYSYADSVQKAQSEAEHVLRLVSSYKDKIKLHIWYDIEDKIQQNLSSSTLSSIINTFCNLISQNGFSVGIYANNSWLKTKIESSIQEKYMIWSAGYGKDDGQPYESSKYNHRNLVLWQFTSNGRLDGIGRVDMNYYYGDESNVTPSQSSSGVQTRKSDEEVAREIISKPNFGGWGTGNERKQKLESAGYNFDTIQAIINRLMKG